MKTNFELMNIECRKRTYRTALRDLIQGNNILKHQAALNVNEIWFSLGPEERVQIVAEIEATPGGLPGMVHGRT